MHKRTSPSVARNTSPIAEVLSAELPASGLVLEIASGSGEHAVAFATAFPGLTWQPSDRDPEALASIDEWAAEAALPNLRPALELDVSALPWPVAAADAVVCINMLHISPWTATVALLRGAAAVLSPEALLFIYGAMKVGGQFTSESDEAFDHSLRSRDPAWGVRDLESVEAAAQVYGLRLVRSVPMPANNFSLVLRRC